MPLALRAGRRYASVGEVEGGVLLKPPRSSSPAKGDDEAGRVSIWFALCGGRFGGLVPTGTLLAQAVVSTSVLPRSPSAASTGDVIW